ncbi:sterol desaturase family protein [Pseudomaricurvus sp. HS19]|uniref:sterol desaturase family protein n=1 Tax=Pseudomaricurvus sp. HS19 TaxID=2692626 RepID=UPI00136DBF33|nr:sterol desaturase family protein [Pseudomaricurvus sp. HS19]MYM64400.1 hypothetical protein [Pseudomaricurvus sp. HS19]
MDKTESFRKYFREEYVPRDAGPRFLYITNGRLYIRVVFAIILTLCVGLASQVDFRPHHLPLFFLYFVIANLVEYWIHRYPMHRKMPLLGFMFEHVTIHHAIFDRDKNLIEDDRDLMGVFLPILYLFSISAGAVVGSLPLFILFGSSEGYFFLFVCAVYYLLYEVLHYSYHCRDDSLFRFVPFSKSLGVNHLIHHRRELMSKVNFNITFPLFDHLFGTKHNPSHLPRDRSEP